MEDITNFYMNTNITNNNKDLTQNNYIQGHFYRNILPVMTHLLTTTAANNNINRLLW